MFKNKQILPSGTVHNALAAGTVIKGDVHAEEDFRIDGTIEGNIECAGKVVVGPSAEITGNIRCENAELMGKITGNIQVRGTLCLKSTVVYNGDITTGNLEIEPGAIFNGTCSMSQSLNS